MFNPYNILNVGFPIYLICFEISLRFVSNVDTSSFVVPTLAASGLGLLIGTVRPKEVSNDAHIEQSLNNGTRPLVVREKRDEAMVLLGWISILIELLGWYFCCALSIKSGGKMFGYNTIPLYTGIGSYAVAVFLSIKKRSD